MKVHCVAGMAMVLLLSSQQPSSASNLYWNFNRIGQQAQARNDYATAEVMYARALEQAEIYGETDPRLVSCLIKLADVYAHENEYALAEPLYQRLMRLAERYPRFDNQVASSLQNYASLESRTNRRDKSELMKQLAMLLQSAQSNQEISNAGFGM